MMRFYRVGSIQYAHIYFLFYRKIFEIKEPRIKSDKVSSQFRLDMVALDLNESKA